MKVRSRFFSSLFERIGSNTFIKSVLTLSLGVVISQAVSLLSTPILSRIYNPANYGDYALLLSDANIISVIVCLGLMTAIMIPKDEEESKGLCRMISKAIFLITTLLYIVALVISPFYKFFSVGLDYKVACTYLWAYVVLSNISSVLYCYVNRQCLYKVLLWNPVIGTTSRAIISIGLGLISPLLIFFLLGAVISVLLVIVHMLRYANPYKGVLPTEYNSKSLLIKYKRFPQFQLPANFIDMVSQQLPVQFIKAFFGSVVLGSYSMCLSILGIPTGFLAAPVNRVYFQEATSRYNAGKDIGEFSYKILEKNIKLAIIPILALVIFGEWIFMILGKDWRMAGSFASILGVYQLVLFCSSCLSGDYVIIGKQRINLLFASVKIVVNILTFVLGYKLFGNVYHVLIIFATAGSICTLIEVGLFLHYTGVNLIRYIRFIILYIIIPVSVSIIIRFGIYSLL